VEGIRDLAGEDQDGNFSGRGVMEALSESVGSNVDVDEDALGFEG